MSTPSAATLAEVFELADQFFEKVMPKMNVGASFLDADAISIWNRLECRIAEAKREARE